MLYKEKYLYPSKMGEERWTEISAKKKYRWPKVHKNTEVKTTENYLAPLRLAHIKKNKYKAQEVKKAGIRKKKSKEIIGLKNLVKY